MNRRRLLVAHGVSLLAALLAPWSAHAQQAIINMPSADITPKGQHFYMHETQMRTQQPGRSWSGTNFYAYGVGKSTELAVTSYNMGSPWSSYAATGLGFKSSPQIMKDRYKNQELKLTVGQMLILNHAGRGVGSFSYSHLSMRLPKLRTRLTGGGFHGTSQLFGVRTANFLGGIEQPLGKRFILLSEWLRGDHQMGYFIPGVLFHPSHNQMIVVGYKIPNNPNDGKSGWVLEWGITFGGKHE
jgi:hypothetical protein